MSLPTPVVTSLQRRLIVKRAIIIAISGLGLGGALFGCHDNTPPPPRVPVPSAENRDVRRTQYDAPRPLDVPQGEYHGGGVYADEPLVVQPVPEQRAFIDAYNRVGRPKITL